MNRTEEVAAERGASAAHNAAVVEGMLEWLEGECERKNVGLESLWSEARSRGTLEAVAAYSKAEGHRDGLRAAQSHLRRLMNGGV